MYSCYFHAHSVTEYGQVQYEKCQSIIYVHYFVVEMNLKYNFLLADSRVLTVLAEVKLQLKSRKIFFY